MTVYVLDSSALIRYLDNEPGAERVEAILMECFSGNARCMISAIQWGEVAANLRSRFGYLKSKKMIRRLQDAEIEIVPVTGEQALRAADLKVGRAMLFTDTFTLELAMRSPEHILVTADYGFNKGANIARIEFLPAS